MSYRFVGIESVTTSTLAEGGYSNDNLAHYAARGRSSGFNLAGHTDYHTAGSRQESKVSPGSTVD